jgi:2-keto-4-pentenoate hydratase/2-oxohepta-3-ene-1,7-dioic acid hydratase in catechol pathway
MATASPSPAWALGTFSVAGSPATSSSSARPRASHYNRHLRDGDVMEGSIAGIGTRRNRCIAQTD